jgi:hypothetical protein
MAVLAALLLAAAEVCPDPAAPCAGFRGHDLSFKRESTGEARAEERSGMFFAVILASAAPCSIDEKARLQAQSRFPGRKVFSARFECDGDVENNVTYTNVDGKRAFLAVYAGTTRAEAEKVLTEARAKGYGGANLRRMQVVFVHP